MADLTERALHTWSPGEVRDVHKDSLALTLKIVSDVLFGDDEVPAAEVGCIAKRDLAPGEVLDAIGQYSYRGFALTRRDAEQRNALPLGLAQGGRVMRRIAKGELLTADAVEPDAGLAIVGVRRSQDAMVRGLTG